MQREISDIPYWEIFWTWCAAAAMFTVFTVTVSIVLGVYYVDHRVIIINEASGFFVIFASALIGFVSGLVAIMFANDCPSGIALDEAQKLLRAGREIMLKGNLAGLLYCFLSLCWQEMTSRCDEFIASEADPEP